MRNDTSSLPVDGPNLTRLIIECKNMTFDQLSCHRDDLEFSELEIRLKKQLDINDLNSEVLKSLGLYKNNEFNIGADLLSDHPSLDNAYVDIAIFGNNISVFKERHTLGFKSVIKQYEEAILLAL